MSGMQDASSLSDEELERARDLGGATYLSAYVHLMARRLEVPTDDKEAMRAMALQMLIPINLATEAAWCALVTDRDGMNEKMRSLQAILEGMI